MNFDSFSRSFFAPSIFGVVDVTGNDAGSFLHRMSTNAIEAMPLSDACLTTFINQKARLIAACYVQRTGDKAFRLIVPYTSAEKLILWLDQYLFVEDVVLTEVSHDFSVLFVLGPSVFNGIEGPDFRLGSSAIPSHISLAPSRELLALKESLRSQGFYELSHEEFESIRIASEIAFSTNEINETSNPIQLGLDSAIHWAKGCYIGQEVISRLESKERSVKSLIGIKVDQETWKALKQGEALSVSHGPVGTLSSVAPLYLPQSANALALFKKTDIPKTFKTDLSNVLIDISSETD